MPHSEPKLRQKESKLRPKMGESESLCQQKGLILEGIGQTVRELEGTMTVVFGCLHPVNLMSMKPGFSTLAISL